MCTYMKSQIHTENVENRLSNVKNSVVALIFRKNIKKLMKVVIAVFVGNTLWQSLLEGHYRAKMNIKFRYFAIFVAFELGRIEAVQFQNDAGSSRRRLTDVSPINEPTFSPVDIRIPISVVPKPSPSEEVSLEETEHVQTDLENSWKFKVWGFFGEISKVRSRLFEVQFEHSF